MFNCSKNKRKQQPMQSGNMISKLDKETYSTPENDAPINALKRSFAISKKLDSASCFIRFGASKLWFW